MRAPLTTLVCLALAGASARAADPAAEEAEFFEKEVRPLLVARCQKCHGAGPKLKGGLNLTGRAPLFKGGDSGPAVVPGKPQESLLVKAVRYADGDVKMPPDGKLPDADVARLERWVAAGVPWPNAVARPAATAGARFVVTDEHHRWWSFRPVRAAALPAVWATVIGSAVPRASRSAASWSAKKAASSDARSGCSRSKVSRSGA